MNGGPDPWLDTVHDLLSESRRRIILYYFLENEHATIDALARRIVSREGNGPPKSVDSTETTELTISLVHKHLPKLERHGVLEYDDRNEDVVRDDDRFGELAEFVRRARQLERDGIDLREVEEQ
ncbi:DUF7344 domain-containing protein [Halobiforma nitratireducens]|uniref:DUF7344 domain-containing protein n=1 Tax=Halobiforma nitratireducens JCM 10879 TaxID=1227454 RepID=M0L3F4_9EURY|nr:hypothetical protein [Halobiforma nitratireducens]EMA28071.1 hypothetical protein C446_17659 [Halobiforma nitratireducens JCM 10879]